LFNNPIYRPLLKFSSYYWGSLLFLLTACTASTEVSSPIAPQVAADIIQEKADTPAQVLSNQALIQHILDRLFETIGDTRYGKPSIQLTSTTNIGATYLPASEIILVEEKLLELSRSFEADSTTVLAFFIGHELGHFFQYQQNKDLSPIPFLQYGEALPSQIKMEKTADIFGVFSAYLAGYLKSGDLLPSIIQQLYLQYQLTEKNLLQYDTLEKRMEIAEEVKLKADTLRQIFRLGNISTLANQPQLAQKCYEHILNYYQSSEIQNNLALNYMLQAMSVDGKRYDNFLFPLELNAETALTLVRADQLSPSAYKKRQQLLSKAASYLKVALSQNAHNFSAQINQFCLLVLQENWQLANLYYLELMQNKNRSTVSKEKIQLVNAILLAQQQKIGPANIIFNSLKNSLNPQVQSFANINSKILTEQSSPFLNSSTDANCLDIQQATIYPTDAFPPYIFEEIPTFYLDEATAIGWTKLNGKLFMTSKRNSVSLLNVRQQFSTTLIKNSSVSDGSASWHIL